MRRLLVLAFIWGWSFLFIKVAVEGLTPSTVAWGRIALGGLVLHVILRSQGVTLPTDRASVQRFVVMGIIGCALPFTLLAWGEQHITSALTSVLNASTPLFTALFAALVGEERLRRMQVAGLGAGFAGVAVAAGVGSSDLHGSSLLGAGAAVLAGVSYGLAFVFMRRRLMGVPPLVAATGQLTAGTVLLAPFALATSLSEGLELTPTRIASIVLLGAVGTGLAFALNYGVVAELGPTKASLVTYLVPVVAVVVGILVLDEPFLWRIPLGGVLTVAGIAAITVGRRTAALGSGPAPAPAPATDATVADDPPPASVVPGGSL
ncbi:MAG TPA: DMT family transporter [Acidimicrobiales bacterium]|jgi:drug/metabolite transporter (DMT)-like permease|nr:DMT family transporter [Acidimicrobiales bacterium]